MLFVDHEHSNTGPEGGFLIEGVLRHAMVVQGVGYQLLRKDLQAISLEWRRMSKASF